MGEENIIRLKNVTKRFGRNVIAVNNANIDIKEGEFFALLGPSGCGKTTIMRMIAGFETPSDGTVEIGGRDMASTPPNQRPVNMVFQSYAVFPHMTVAQNIAYGLEIEKLPKSELEKRVADGLQLVRMEQFAERRPNQLSGGQLQRVALARALVKRPKVLLLDEPMSALDAKLREEMRVELVNLQYSVGITFVVVTHDQKEALSMADRVAVMNLGEVKQIATPSVLYEMPSSKFVANFIGKMTMLPAKLLGSDGTGSKIDIPYFGELVVDTPISNGGDLVVGVRPEKINVSYEEPDGHVVKMQGSVKNVMYCGGETHVYLDVKGETVVSYIQNTRRDSHHRFKVGETAWCHCLATEMVVLEG